MLKLTTDKQEASRGLSATAQLLVGPLSKRNTGMAALRSCLPVINENYMQNYPYSSHLLRHQARKRIGTIL